jgi:hypothetical protein
MLGTGVVTERAKLYKVWRFSIKDATLAGRKIEPIIFKEK